MKDLSVRKENNFFSPFYNGYFGELDRMFERAQQLGHEFVEKESHYLASIDMPGVRNDDIEITIDENILRVEATRKSENGTKVYSSSFLLPNNVHNDKEVKAIYEDGVLSIALPKTNSSNSKKISLSSDDSDGFFKKLFSSNESKKIAVDQAKH